MVDVCNTFADNSLEFRKVSSRPHPRKKAGVVMHSSLKAARSRADLTLSELAEKSGVAIDTISAIERGVRVPQARTLHKLARALGVDPAILISEEKIAV